MPTGIWLIGGRGSVAATSVAGALAIRAGLVPPTGCVTELPELRGAVLPAFGDLVFGGHDPASIPLDKKAEALATAGVLPATLVAAVSGDLAAVDAEIRPLPAAASQAGTAELLVADLVSFRDRRGLDQVVVMNLSSTEPAPPPHPAHDSLPLLDSALRGGRPVLPWSALYARLTAAAQAAGYIGPLTDLAFFFQDPLGTVGHGLAEQWQALTAFAARLDPRMQAP